ncbi:MAG: 16S rRNA (guanine(966)-N(2))-methyltransferase RsmD [Gemmatimonadaceae bacterium]
MRIVGGRWRGHRLRPPADARVRPTADRVREAWMSILQLDLPDASVLDVFAGSGALGLEALSRGASRAEFVEIGSKSLTALRENAAKLRVESEIVVHKGDAIRFIDRLEAKAFDICFADPPYGLGLADKVASRWLTVNFSRILGIEHRHDDPVPAGGDSRRYGDSALTFYRTGD